MSVLISTVKLLQFLKKSLIAERGKSPRTNWLMNCPLVTRSPQRWTTFLLSSSTKALASAEPILTPSFGVVPPAICSLSCPLLAVRVVAPQRRKDNVRLGSVEIVYEAAVIDAA